MDLLMLVYVLVSLLFAIGGLYIMSEVFEFRYFALLLFAVSVGFLLLAVSHADEKLQQIEQDLTIEIADKLNADVNEIIVKDDRENGTLKTVYYDGQIYIVELKNSHVEKIVLSEGEK